MTLFLWLLWMKQSAAIETKNDIAISCRIDCSTWLTFSGIDWLQMFCHHVRTPIVLSFFCSHWLAIPSLHPPKIPPHKSNTFQQEIFFQSIELLVTQKVEIISKIFANWNHMARQWTVNKRQTAHCCGHSIEKHICASFILFGIRHRFVVLVSMWPLEMQNLNRTLPFLKFA